MHHLPVIYEHLTVKEKVALNHITKMASKLSNIKLSSLLTTVAGRVKTKVLRMVAVSSSPVLKLDTLPSGRYKTLRHRTYCHSYKVIRNSCRSRKFPVASPTPQMPRLYDENTPHKKMCTHHNELSVIKRPNVQFSELHACSLEGLRGLLRCYEAVLGGFLRVLRSSHVA